MAKLSTWSITYLCWCKWQDILKEKRHGKVTKGVLFSNNNAPAHQALATHKKPAYLGFQCLDHPPYSPDLAPSDYHLFPGLKIQLKGHHFLSDAEVIAAAETWLDGQPSEFFLSGLQKLQQRTKKSIELHGEYAEKTRVWSLYLVSFLVGLRTYQRPLVKHLTEINDKTSKSFMKKKCIHMHYSFTVLTYLIQGVPTVSV